MLLGVRGAIGGNWNYDASYQRGEVKRQIRLLNDINGVFMQQALQATDVNECRDPSSGCVPINLFGVEGTITPAMAAFVRLNLLSDELYTQEVTSAYVSGPLGKTALPWADKPISAAFGLEYRRESGSVTPDANLANPNIPVGFGQTVPVSGEFSVKEAFTELLVPLVEGKSFADSLDLQFGYRYSDYDISGKTDTYRAGLSWAPVPAVRLRAEYQRAVRAPNIQELFAPVTFGTGNLATDPCAGAGPTLDPGLAALCVATGAPQARVDSGSIAQPISGQANNFTGGNLQLTPETGDTWTYGVVLNLGDGWGRVRHPTMALDYYRMDIKDAINVFAIADVMNGCYSAALNPGREFNALCAAIARNPITGTLSGGPTTGVTTLSANLAFQKVEGIDLNATFGVDLGNAGKLDVDLIANYYLKNDFQNSAFSSLNECAGIFGQNCSGTVGGPVSKARLSQRTTWTRGDLEIGYLWRFLSGVREEAATSVLPEFANISNYSYVDLTAAYHFGDTTTLRAGIANLLDKAPPFVGGSAGDTTSNGGNTFPGYYDALGRTFTLGVRLKF